MSDRFPPLRPSTEAGRKATQRAAATSGPAVADYCLVAALVLSLALALV
ncbi:MAG: hypothetical protein ACK47Z_00945 [Paracoccaceae bacterium]